MQRIHPVLQEKCSYAVQGKHVVENSQKDPGSAKVLEVQPAGSEQSP